MARQNGLPWRSARRIFLQPALEGHAGVHAGQWVDGALAFEVLVADGAGEVGFEDVLDERALVLQQFGARLRDISQMQSLPSNLGCSSGSPFRIISGMTMRVSPSSLQRQESGAVCRRRLFVRLARVPAGQVLVRADAVQPFCQRRDGHVATAGQVKDASLGVEDRRHAAGDHFHDVVEVEALQRAREHGCLLGCHPHRAVLLDLLGHRIPAGRHAHDHAVAHERHVADLPAGHDLKHPVQGRFRRAVNDVARHDLFDGRAVQVHPGPEAVGDHVAFGEDALEFAPVVDDHDTADRPPLHQVGGLAQSCFGPDGNDIS